MFDFILLDAMGILLSFAVFALAFAYRPLWREPWCLIALEVSIFFHEIVAYLNSYAIRTLGADADAQRFHDFASQVASGEATWQNLVASPVLYEQILSKIYEFCGSSQLFGSQLSILAFVISSFYFFELCKLLELKSIHWLLLFFGALPTMLMFGSVTLRESYQVLFFMALVHHGFRFQMTGNLVHILSSAIAGILLGLSHNGLGAFAFFAVAVLFWFPFKAPRKNSWTQISVRRWSAILALLAMTFLFVRRGGLSGSTMTQAILDGAWAEYLKGYQEGAMRSLGRTVYPVMLDFSSAPRFALTYAASIFFYLFSPMPWQVSSFMDVYAMIESMFRFALIYFAARELFCESPNLRAKRLLAVLYISLTCLWALGTISYGTAIRHHLTNYWILLLLGGPRLVQFIGMLLSTVGSRSSLLRSSGT